MHDPTATILKNGKIIASIEEERINGIKGSKGIFPAQAIEEVLKIANLHKSDVDKIAVPYSPSLWKDRFNLEMESIHDRSLNENRVVDYERLIKLIDQSNLVNRFKFFDNEEEVKALILKKAGFEKNVEVEFHEHHLSHAASSYYLSGFDEAIAVIVDGIGEVAATTVWEIRNGVFKKLTEIKYPNSLGYFYSIATAFLGFKPWEQEGKLMALAPYGRPNKELQSKLKSIIDIKNDVYEAGDFIRDNSTNFLMLDNELAIKSIEKITGVTSRKSNEPILEIHKDFAYAVQTVLEESVRGLVDRAVEETGLTKVCVAGGIFMNCKMNMYVRENSKAQDYFVQPLAGDLGLGFGAGILSSEYKTSNNFVSLSYGPSFSNEEIEARIKARGLTFEKVEDIAKETARLLTEGNIVCWFQGRLEMGARALGNRSILSDPRGEKVSDIINERVKHREVWRPFACSMMEDFASEVLERYREDKKYAFMIEAFKVKDQWVDKIPAVIHKADGSTRPQVVCKEDYPLYYNLIKNFYELTGCPLILNTSFNDKGQPIVMTPDLAIEFFIKNDVDILSIGNYIVKKSN